MLLISVARYVNQWPANPSLTYQWFGCCIPHYSQWLLSLDDKWIANASAPDPSIYDQIYGIFSQSQLCEISTRVWVKASSYYHAHRSGFPSHRRLLAHWPAEPSPRLVHYTRREHLQRARYNQQHWHSSIRKTWGVHTGRVLAFKNSSRRDGTVNAGISRSIVKS